MQSALVIEDSPEFQLLVRATLADDFQVTCSGDASSALTALEKNSFDIILIDVGLPGKDGLALCEELRLDPRHSATPILFVTGRKETSDIIQGFAVGADDYIHKPFHPDELRARVKARVARFKASGTKRGNPDFQDSFWKANLHFFVGRQRVSARSSDQNERDLGLTPNEFKILYYLAKNEAKTLSRSEILREVWGEDLHVVERTVDKHICSLRRKMDELAGHVTSIPGQGYAFHSVPVSGTRR